MPSFLKTCPRPKFVVLRNDIQRYWAAGFADSDHTSIHLDKKTAWEVSRAIRGLLMMAGDSAFEDHQRLIAEIVHIVLWKLKRPSGLSGSAAEEALSKAKAAIGNLRGVPGPESVCSPL